MEHAGDTDRRRCDRDQRQYDKRYQHLDEGESGSASPPPQAVLHAVDVVCSRRCSSAKSPETHRSRQTGPPSDPARTVVAQVQKIKVFGADVCCPANQPLLGNARRPPAHPTQPRPSPCWVHAPKRGVPLPDFQPDQPLTIVLHVTLSTMGKCESPHVRPTPARAVLVMRERAEVATASWSAAIGPRIHSTGPQPDSSQSISQPVDQSDGTWGGRRGRSRSSRRDRINRCSDQRFRNERHGLARVP